MFSCFLLVNCIDYFLKLKVPETAYCNAVSGTRLDFQSNKRHERLEIFEHSSMITALALERLVALMTLDASLTLKIREHRLPLPFLFEWNVVWGVTSDHVTFDRTNPRGQIRPSLSKESSDDRIPLFGFRHQID